MSCEPTSAGFRPPERVKPHRTLRVTPAMLRKIGACAVEVRKLARAGLLPAELSTDPEDNIKLALRYDAYDHGRNPHTWPHTWPGRSFLYLRYLLPEPNLADRHDLYDASHDTRTEDPYYLAQVMALVADRILTERGR